MHALATAVHRPAGDYAELRAQAKEHADRKVMRFLAGVELAPFVAACRLLAQAPDLDSMDHGLLTVSGWEAGPSPLDGEFESSEDVALGLAKQFRDQMSPTDWLKDMGNNMLCQVAIATSAQGVNCHYVGDGTTMQAVLGLACHSLAQGDARRVVVVAFDLEDPATARATNEVSAAVAVALEPVAAGAEGVVLDVRDVKDVGDLTAVEVLEAWVDAIESPPSADTAVRAGTVHLGTVERRSS